MCSNQSLLRQSLTAFGGNPCGDSGRGSDSPPDCHSLPRHRYANPLHKGAFGLCKLLPLQWERCRDCGGEGSRGFRVAGKFRRSYRAFALPILRNASKVKEVLSSVLVCSLREAPFLCRQEWGKKRPGGGAEQISYRYCHGFATACPGNNRPPPGPPPGATLLSIPFFVSTFCVASQQYGTIIGSINHSLSRCLHHRI